MDHPFIIQNIIVQTDRQLIDKYIEPKKVKTPKEPKKVKEPKEPKKVKEPKEKVSSAKLKQIAAGYKLCADNATKREASEKKSNS